MGTYQTFSMGDHAGGGMMNLPAGMAGAPAWSFYFTVEDIQAAARHVTAAGGAITQGPMQVPGGAWVLRGTDGRGGSFALTGAR